MSLFKKERTKYIVDYSIDNSIEIISEHIYSLLQQYKFDHWTIICIGTDRSTGDSLGPLIGSKLQLSMPPETAVIGTLDEPVHALNLQDNIKFINDNFPNSGILAIDASLGKVSSVGTVQIVDGPIKPGAGVQKDLPEIGHFHITGIVNIGGFMEYLVLQNTRLSLVFKMSEIISKSINKSFRIYKYAKKENVIWTSP